LRRLNTFAFFSLVKGVFQQRLFFNGVVLRANLPYGEIGCFAKMLANRVAVLQHRKSDAPNRGLGGFIVHDDPLDTGYLTFYGVFDAVSDLMRLFQIVGAQGEIDVQETEAPCAAAHKGFNFPDRRLFLNNFTRRFKGAVINRGIQQHAHTIGKQLPAGFGDKDQHQQGRNAIDG